MIEEFKKKSQGSVTMRSLNLAFATTEKIEYPYFDYVYTMYDAYSKRGNLPFDGSLTDQPAKIMEIFGVLKALEIERERQQLDEAQREAKRNK